MKHFMLSCLLTIVAFSSVRACDVCGGGMPFWENGLLMGLKGHFVQMAYQHTAFELSSNGSLKSKDEFHQWNVNARWQLNNKWRVYAQIPMTYQQRSDITNTTVSNKGLGDVNLQLGAVVLQKQWKTGLWRGLTVEVLGGIRFPTGSFDRRLIEENMPLYFNPGAGTEAYTLGLQGLLLGEKGGWQWEARTLQTTINPYAYQRGNQYLGSVQYFHYIGKKVNWTGLGGVFYQKQGEDTYYGSLEKGTGGTVVGTSLGLQFQRNAWSTSLSVRKPWLNSLETEIYRFNR